MFNHRVQGSSQLPIARLLVLHVTNEEEKKKKSESQIWRRRRSKRAESFRGRTSLAPSPPQESLVRGHAGLVMNKLSMSMLRTPRPPSPKKLPLQGPMEILGGWVFLMSEVPL